jgi:hypothetical protein
VKLAEDFRVIGADTDCVRAGEPSTLRAPKGYEDCAVGIGGHTARAGAAKRIGL